MNWNRKKTSHTKGVVGKVKWVAVKNEGGYTGIFKTGTDHAIIRLSETVNQTPDSSGLMPSMAIKFLIDG